MAQARVGPWHLTCLRLTFSGLAVLIMMVNIFLCWNGRFEMNRETLLNLKKTLNFAEAGLELQHLSLLEKEMYYGVLEIADHNNEFSSDLLKDTVKMLDIPHATYHRVVRSLLQKGFITKANDRKRNAYVLIKTI